MEFSEYLINKNIDEVRFSKEDPQTFMEFKRLFEQMHPKSFTLQKLYLINPVRRKYPLPPELKKNVPSRSSRPSAPVIRKVRQPESDTENVKPRPVFKPRMPQKTSEGGETNPSKPVLRPKMPGKKEESGEGTNTPTKKPVMKPKIPSGKDTSPSAPRPVTKPRIPGDEQKSNSSDDHATPKKPIIKPRIPSKATQSNEHKEARKGPPRPVIKPRISGDVPSKDSPGTDSSEQSDTPSGTSKKPIIKPRKKNE